MTPAGLAGSGVVLVGLALLLALVVALLVHAANVIMRNAHDGYHDRLRRADHLVAMATVTTVLVALVAMAGAAVLVVALVQGLLG